MSDVPYPSDFERLEGNIREEVNAQLGMAGVDLDQLILDNLVAGLAVNIDHAFEVRWRPSWVKAGDAHRWKEGAADGERHFVECVACKRITVHRSADDGEPWHAEHRRTHHP